MLHLFEGRSLGIAQFILSVIGIYASWDDVTNRVGFITTFGIGCFIWATCDLLYLFVILAASSDFMHSALVGLVVSNTFPNLAPALDTLLDTIAEDSHFFTVFAAVTSVFFDILATYWTFYLYKDVLDIQASSDIRVPLMRPQSAPQRNGISGFGTLSRPAQQPQPPPRSIQPFGGRGHRLGFEET